MFDVEEETCFVTNERCCFACGVPSSKGCTCGQHVANEREDEEEHDDDRVLNYVGGSPLGLPVMQF